MKTIKKGVVISDKMSKTVVVEVKSFKNDSVYGKRLKISKKYYAHDEKDFYKEGDKVQITEYRPKSKLKRWKVLYNDKKTKK